MCLLNFLKPKAKKKAAPEKEKVANKKADLILGGLGTGKARRADKKPFSEPDIPDEEYQLPTLARGNFSMNEELRRRQMEEQLKKKYGISFAKEGSVV